MATKIPESGYLTAFYFRNIPILIHWTFPVGGLFVASFLGDFSWKSAIALVIAYTTLILVHELGHALAAHIQSLKVHAVVVTATGGVCFVEKINAFSTLLIFYAGGIIAQFVALLIAITLIALFDNPSSVISGCFSLVYTVVNVILIVVNIIPTQGSDGKKILELLKERIKTV